MQGKWWILIMRAAGTGFLGLLVYLVLNERSGQEITLIAGAFCFLMSLDAEKWKLGLTGVEAEMRKAVEEAKASLAELQGLAEIFARSSLQTMMSGSRIGGMSRAKQRQITDEIIGNLVRLKMPSETVDEIRKIPRVFQHFDHIQYVMSPAFKMMTPEQSQAWSAWHLQYQGGFGSEPDPDVLKAFLVGQGLYEGDVVERIADYQQYHTDGTYRRLDVWENPVNLS